MKKLDLKALTNKHEIEKALKDNKKKIKTFGLYMGIIFLFTIVYVIASSILDISNIFNISAYLLLLVINFIVWGIIKKSWVRHEFFLKLKDYHSKNS